MSQAARTPGAENHAVIAQSRTPRSKGTIARMQSATARITTRVAMRIGTRLARGDLESGSPPGSDEGPGGDANGDGSEDPVNPLILQRVTIGVSLAEEEAAEKLDGPQSKTDRRRRRWPGRLDGGLDAREAGCAAAGARAGLPGRRHRPHGRIQGLPVRHRRPSLLHQGRRRSEAVAEHARARDAAAPSPLADLLRRQVLRLPAEADERADGARDRQRVPRAPQLPLDPDQADQARGQLRGLGVESLRPPALQHLLQDLHGEGLGHSLQRIGAQWAAQRIKGLSLFTAVINMLLRSVTRQAARSRSRR